MLQKITVAKLFYQMNKKTDINDKCFNLFIQEYLHYIMRVRLSDNLQVIESLFASEPKRYNTIPQDVYAYMAATVEQLTIELHITAPSWINKQFYFLEEPWFPKEVLKYTKLKESLKKLSPDAFKKRNLYVSENAISVM